jgi:hypothetical protein
VTGFDATAAMEGLLALVMTVPSIEAGQLGAPESTNERIGAWVSMGDPNVIESRMQGVYEFDFNLIVYWRYTVEGSETAAESALGDFLSELTRRMIQNRMGTVDGVARNLNGSVDMMGLPQAALGGADYSMMAGQENRLYPIGIRVIQREALGV